MDSVRKETLAVSVMMEHLETDAVTDKKGQSSSPAPKAQTQDGKKPSKGSGLGGRVLLEQEAELRAEISCGKSVQMRRVITGTLPCV